MTAWVQAIKLEELASIAMMPQGKWKRYVSLSPDGRYVAFDSWASNLVSGDANGAWDVFVHDRQAHTTERVSVSSMGEEGKVALVVTVS